MPMVENGRKLVAHMDFWHLLPGLVVLDWRCWTGRQ